MNKLMVPFDTYPVNTTLDPSGGFAMRPGEQQVLEDDAVYEEVIKEETLPLSVKFLKFIVNAVLAATSKKTSQDCRPRRVGNEIKFVVALRGKLAGPYSAFDSETCSAVVLAMPMKGCTKKVDLSRVHLYNTRTGLKVTIDRITYEGSTSGVGVIMKDTAIVVTGLNCQWLDGDSCTLAWKDAEGNPQTASITPTSSSVTEMKFAWPAALADVAAGTEVDFNFLTRGGIEEAEPQPNKKTVTVLANDTPSPTVTKVATAGKAGVVKGQAFDIEGTNLAYASGDSVKAKWTVGGTPGELALTPTGTVTATKMSFAAVAAFDALPDNAELTFEVKVGGVTVTKATTLLPEEPIAQTSDGKCKVRTFKDGGSATEFTLGSTWTATGSGFYAAGAAPAGEWAKDEIGLTVGGKYLSFEPTIAGDHQSFTLGEYSGDAPAAGTYENVELQLNVTRDGGTETLRIPLAKLVVS